jgi:subtilisin family serine protease
LDPAAGHGTFIAGLVDQVAPGCDITVHRVLSTFGDGDEAGIVDCLDALVIDDPHHTIVNLSFGGYVLDHPYALARAIRHLQATGVVVVSSAGNDATCRPTFPAALPGVVGVGAIGPNGPAPFTNYGPWVRACAPGVDLLSTFFDHWNGSDPTGANGQDPDAFVGWALWSGTSFAAPVVVGALARVMVEAGCTAREAVTRVVDAPALMRIPNLGTVVNVI